MHNQTQCVLAVAPVSRGIGYVVFSDPKTPIDWGVRTARTRKEEVCQRHVEALITCYQPDVLVLESFDLLTNRPRVSALNDKLHTLGTYQGLRVSRLTRNNVQAVFSQFGSSTKFGIAKTISDWFPELGVRMPRYRQPWRKEDHAMAMFEAAALALSHYYINS